MNVILRVLYFSLDLLILFMFLHKVNQNTDDKFKTIYILSVLCITGISYINHDWFIYLLRLFLIMFIVNKCYHIGFIYSLLFSIFYLFISLSLENLLFLLSDFGYIYLILFINSLKGFIFFSVFPLKKLIEGKIHLKALLAVMILPITSVFLILGLQNIKDGNNYLKIAVLLLLCANFINVYILYKVNESEVLNTELLTLKEYEKVNKLYYDLIVEKYNANRKYIHDFNKHVNILKQLSDSEDYYRIHEYINSMSEASKQINNKAVSGNKALDVVLTTVMDRHDISNISFVYEKIEDLQFKNEYFYSFVTILYNVLENAIESCNQCKEGTIRIKLHHSDSDYFVIRIINTSKYVDVSSIKTMKENKDKHGLGLSIVKEEVQKLHGEYTVIYDESTKEFKLYISLPVTILR